MHGTGDAAFHGKPLVIERVTWTTPLPANAVLHELRPGKTGKRGRPRENGDRIGTCADAAGTAKCKDVTVTAYGKEAKIQAAARPALWPGSFGSPPGQLVLAREPDSAKAYDLGIFTLDTSLSAEQAIERYSWRWPPEPSNAAGKQVTGAGDACTRTARAVQRAVPFAFAIQSLMITWYAVSCDPAAGMQDRRRRCPWYRSKAAPSAADMRDALRGELLAGRFSAIGPGQNRPPKNGPGVPACHVTAA